MNKFRFPKVWHCSPQTVLRTCSLCCVGVTYSRCLWQRKMCSVYNSQKQDLISSNWLQPSPIIHCTMWIEDEWDRRFCQVKTLILLKKNYVGVACFDLFPINNPHLTAFGRTFYLASPTSLTPPKVHHNWKFTQHEYFLDIWKDIR